MKVRTVAALAGISMMLSSVSVWSLTEPRLGVGASETRGSGLTRSGTERAGSAFSTGDGLRLEGRLGHEELASGQAAETFALFTVRGEQKEDGARAGRRSPLHLVIVIDRSGSMAGKRLDNALAAARGAVSRLASDDQVSVIEYSSTASVLVAPTELDGAGRERVLSRLSSIAAAGETCISCALKSSIGALRGRDGVVERVLLLSDGEATAGVRDLEGLRLVADDVRRAGASVTTIGVDVEYNERVMAEIARQSSGRHYFVENPSGLASIFDRELEGLERTVARRATLRLEAPDGVELVEVMDRAFQREGSELVVDLGSVAAGEERTVLVRLRARDGSTGRREVVGARLSYDDLASGRGAECSGRLSANFVRDPRSTELDPLVEERVRRSTTASVLTEANQLFAKGDAESARQRLEETRRDLERSRQKAVAAAPIARKPALEQQFSRQEAALGEAEKSFAKAPPAGAGDDRAGRAAVRRSQEAANAFGF